MSALVAGAAAGGRGAVTAAINDAYDGLKALVATRLADRGSAQVALDQVEVQAVDAGSAEAVALAWRGVLGEELARVGADTDTELDGAARRLLAVLDGAGAAEGASIDRLVPDLVHLDHPASAGEPAVTVEFGAHSVSSDVPTQRDATQGGGDAPPRRFGFIGTISAEPDLSERVEDILRGELGST